MILQFRGDQAQVTLPGEMTNQAAHIEKHITEDGKKTNGNKLPNDKSKK